MQALRVVGVILLSLFVVAASCLFALLTVCGAWKSNDAVPWMFLMLALIAGGIVGIAFLGRAIHRHRRTTNAALPPQEDAVIDPLQYTNALMSLRIAVGIRIGLAVATMVLQHTQPLNPYSGRYLPIAIFTVLFYQLPNGWVLWNLRERIERNATVFAFCYALVGVVWTLFNLVPLLRYASMVQGYRPFLAPLGIAVASEVFVVVAAFRARAVLQRRDDSVAWIVCTVISIGISVVGQTLAALLVKVL